MTRDELETTRRHFILKPGMGLGWLTLAELAGTSAWAQQSPVPADAHAGLPGLPHFAPRAKRVVYLHMLGAADVVSDRRPRVEVHAVRPKRDDGQRRRGAHGTDRG
jgi:hypothetical protein